MDMEIGECVGICETDGQGNTVKLEREYFRQGWIFKDWGAFRNNPDAPCYVPELNDTVYTKRDFLALCNDQEEIAEELFEQLDWQSPSTLFNEWEDMARQNLWMVREDDGKACPYYEGNTGDKQGRTLGRGVLIPAILNENREENAIMKEKEKNAGCEHCANLVPIGEGDHICYECGEPVMPVSGYIPTDDYLKCGGRKYERG